jgi:hypothetical protein
MNAAARNKLLLSVLSSQFLRRYIVIHDIYRHLFPADENVNNYYSDYQLLKVFKKMAIGLAFDHYKGFSLSENRLS